MLLHIAHITHTFSIAQGVATFSSKNYCVMIISLTYTHCKYFHCKYFNCQKYKYLLCPEKSLHCKFLPHENYGDLKFLGPCRENLYYLEELQGNPVIIGLPDNCRFCNYYEGSSQFLQPFSIYSADFPCRDTTIPSPRSFHVVKICSVFKYKF